MAQNKKHHLTAVKRQWEINALVAEGKFRLADGKLKKIKPRKGEHAANDLETLIDAALADERRVFAAAMENVKIGDKMPDGTVYAGTYTPPKMKKLSETFHVFAAPKDLQTESGKRRAVQTYDETVEHIAGLRDFYGYDGAGYKNETEIFKALGNGEYDGEWIMPPREILCGKDAEGNKTAPDNLLTHKNKGALKNTFRRPSYDAYYAGGGDDAEYYWSSTELKDNNGYAYRVNITQNYHDNARKSRRSICRPVRLVPAN